MFSIILPLPYLEELEMQKHTPKIYPQTVNNHVNNLLANEKASTTNDGSPLVLMLKKCTVVKPSDNHPYNTKPDRPPSKGVCSTE
jgi:hypothetical protein